MLFSLKIAKKIDSTELLDNNLIILTFWKTKQKFYS